MRQRGKARLVWRLMAVVGALAGMTYTVAFVLVLIVSQLDERRQADAIVVLGAAQ